MNPLIFDAKRHIVIPGDQKMTLQYAVDDWVRHALSAIDDHGYFAVALSGGSTPKTMYQKLAQEKKEALDWSKVILFWSDERAVPLQDKDSNYRMALEAGFDDLPIPENQIFPMQGEGDLEANAKAYEELILTKIPP